MRTHTHTSGHSDDTEDLDKSLKQAIPRHRARTCAAGLFCQCAHTETQPGPQCQQHKLGGSQADD